LAKEIKIKPLPLSHSNLDKFETCPKQFEAVKVSKVFVDVKGEAARWGDYVHIQFEKYLRAGGIYELPENVAQYKPYLDHILAPKGDLYVEHPMAVNTKLEPCDFYADNVWMRGYADVLRVRGDRAWVLDHKTGKRKPGSRQMKRMAMLVFMLFPAVTWIKVGFAWLQEKLNDAEEFDRADMLTLWGEELPLIQQYKAAFTTDTWQPRPSGLCHGWCPVTTCEFWKPKRMRDRP